MFKGTRVRVSAREILMGFNTTAEAIGIRHSSEKGLPNLSLNRWREGEKDRRFWSQEQEVSLHQNLKALIRYDVLD